MTDVILVEVSGQGDVSRYFVPASFGEWVNSLYVEDIKTQFAVATPKHIVDEIEGLHEDFFHDYIEDSLDEDEDYVNKTLYLSWGSHENDAYLQVMGLFNLRSFETINEIMEFTREHNLNIVSEYYGYIY